MDYYGTRRECLTSKSPSEILMYQICTCSSMAIIISLLLKPLGIPVMISQILAGLLLGPTFLGQMTKFTSFVFPHLSMPLFKIFINFGMILQLFLMGIEIDLSMSLKIGKQGLVLGTSAIAVPLTLSWAFWFFLSSFRMFDKHHLSRVLYMVGVGNSMSSFPVIASYLHDLNIVNSELSQMAFTCCFITGFFCYLLQIFYTITDSILTLLAAYVVISYFILYVLRRAVQWSIKQIPPKGNSNLKGHINTLIITACVLCYVSMAMGIQPLFATFLFGLVIPPRSPLGSAVARRLKFLLTWVIMPLFFSLQGWSIDVSEVKLIRAFQVESIIIVSWIGKFLGAFLPALYYNMTYTEATLLGIIMNTQGFIEMSYLKFMKDKKVIDAQSYDIMCVSMLITTGSLTPLVRYLYKASLQHKFQHRRSIQHSGLDGELRVLTCIFDQENVPSAIYLLKAMNPTKERPIVASVIHFLELVGRTVPVIISHKLNKSESTDSAPSHHIVNAFQSYEEHEKGKVSIDPYTAISPYATMHHDVHRFSLRRRTSLIILPYHKHFAAGVSNLNIRTVNCNVLKGAPCSVGILIDRGRLAGVKYVKESWIVYHVAVLFFGGADDREALAIGARMSGNPNVELTVIRFLKTEQEETDDNDDDNDNDNDNDAEESNLLDNEVLADFNMRTAGNSRVTYGTEVVETCAGVIQVIEKMEAKYELVVLGRHQNEDSELIVELSEWDTCSELGTMGDLFTRSDYGGNATILVVEQQQTTDAV